MLPLPPDPRAVSDGPPSLGGVLITPELDRRPGRLPDYERQARALDSLASSLSESPGDALQRLTEVVVELCGADSAGVSLSDEAMGEATGTPAFHWVAVAGVWADKRGGTMPIDASPCGVVMERNQALLFAHPERHFPAAHVHPLIAEILLVPFHLGGRPVGTLWAAAHDEERKFDREDVRLLLSLSQSAAVIVQTTRSLAALRDSERRRHRDELNRAELLAGELHHRVKNTLAVVQAIVAQSLRGAATPAEARKSVEARLQALGRAQDLLVGDGLTGADLRAVVDEALRPHDDGAPGRFEVDGPPVWLSARAATALALMLHELATNATKHGALSAPEGRVAIGWTLSGGAEEERLRFTWRERGGPPVEPPRRHGFGTRLIEGGLTGAAGQTVRLAYEPAGASCEIEVPTASLRDASGG